MVNGVSSTFPRRFYKERLILRKPVCISSDDKTLPNKEVCWLVVLGSSGLEAVFQSISSRLPERVRKKREMIDERKNVQTTSTRTDCKRSRSCCSIIQISRMARHWKFTQHHHATRPPHKKSCTLKERNCCWRDKLCFKS